jgi:hypothetical protein
MVPAKPPGNTLRALSPAGAAILVRLKLMLPTMQLGECRRMLQLVAGATVSVATISRELDRMHFSWRVIRPISAARDPIARMNFKLLHAAAARRHQRCARHPPHQRELP